MNHLLAKKIILLQILKYPLLMMNWKFLDHNHCQTLNLVQTLKNINSRLRETSELSCKVISMPRKKNRNSKTKKSKECLKNKINHYQEEKEAKWSIMSVVLRLMRKYEWRFVIWEMDVGHISTLHREFKLGNTEDLKLCLGLIMIPLLICGVLPAWHLNW